MRIPSYETIYNKFSKKLEAKKDLSLQTNLQYFVVNSFFFFFPVGIITLLPNYVQFSSATQLSLNLCNPTDSSTPYFPVHHQLPELVQTHFHELVIPSNHLILCHPLLLPSSLFPTIRVFSNKSVLHIRWPKYWSFSFNISPSNEHSGLCVGKIPWRREWLPTPVFLPEEFHEPRSLAGCSPWGCKELDTTEWLTFSLSEHTTDWPNPPLLFWNVLTIALAYVPTFHRHPQNCM